MGTTTAQYAKLLSDALENISEAEKFADDRQRALLNEAWNLLNAASTS